MRRSSEISALKIREAKSWKVIDQYIGKARTDVKIQPATRLEAAVFVLKRLYPEKTKIEGTGFDQGKQFIVVYPQGMKKEELNGSTNREAILSQNISS